MGKRHRKVKDLNREGCFMGNKIRLGRRLNQDGDNRVGELIEKENITGRGLNQEQNLTRRES